MSAGLRTRLGAVAPAMIVQLAPSVSQRHHSYVVVKTTGPTQVPSMAVSTSPSCGVPATVGGVTLTGGFVPAAPVSVDVWVLEPAPFVAGTAIRSAQPTAGVVSM